MRTAAAFRKIRQIRKCFQKSIEIKAMPLTVIEPGLRMTVKYQGLNRTLYSRMVGSLLNCLRVAGPYGFTKKERESGPD